MAWSAGTAAAQETKPRICLVSITDSTRRAAPKSLRKTVEAAVRATRKVQVIPFQDYAAAGKNLEIPPEEWSAAENLDEIGGEIELDVALMVFVSRHGKRYRLMIAAVDPLDGTELTSWSSWLKSPRLSARNAKEMATTLIDETLQTLEESAEEEPPPPPPPPAP